MTNLLEGQRNSPNARWESLGWVLVLAIIWGCQNQYPSQPFAHQVQADDQNKRFAENFPPTFGFGRDATSQEIDSLSIAIMPDGTGLPAGKGTALDGDAIYRQKCIACHGASGREGPFDALVATEAYFTENKRVAKAIGNYWPYSTTVFDYVRRAMPLDAPGSLTDDEVYSVKWIRRIEVSDQPFMTREETSKYTEPVGGRIRQFSFIMQARSIITFPFYPQQVEKGWMEISGLAWSGQGKIAAVEVSTDGGKSWTNAQLQATVLVKAHVRFTHLWYWNGQNTEIRSRAVDDTGYVQPSLKAIRQARGSSGGYHFNPVTGWVLRRDGSILFIDDF